MNSPAPGSISPSVAIPPAARFPSRAAPRKQPDPGSRAAFLVLVTNPRGARALLFNGEGRCLGEVIDDPLTVDRLCAAGLRCDVPDALALAAARGPHDDADVLCFALGAAG